MSRKHGFTKLSALLISLILLGLTIAGSFLISLRGEVVVTEKRLNKLPYTISKWTGEDHKFDYSIYEWLDADDNLYRHYHSNDDRPVWLYIGYYGTAKRGSTYHLPYYCYPGTGWIIMDVSEVDVPWPSRNSTVRINKMVVKKEDKHEVVLYWIHSAGHKVLNFGPKLKLKRLWGKITTNRQDGAFVRISAPVLNGSVDETVAYEKEFISQLLDKLPDCWPVEEDAT